MRLKQSRVRTLYARKHSVIKDNEGNTHVEYGPSVSFTGEVWPASGKVQAQMYGDKLSYIRNVRIEDEYKFMLDEKGVIHYLFASGLDLTENDGLCLYVEKNAEPDYKVLSIKPYSKLMLEAEKL